MPSIAIVGAGISGVHLALRLQQSGISTVLYAERGPDEIAAGRPSNLVVRFGATRERETALGVAHWDAPELDVHGLNVAIDIDPPVRFFGRFARPGSAIDFRVYLPRLIRDYQERGGEVRTLRPTAEAVTALAGAHDLVVVSTGRDGATGLFPVDPARSPFSAPQRLICAGLWRGIAPSDPSWIHFQPIPEVGEIFSTRVQSLDGPVHGMVIEALPGGPLESLVTMPLEEDPAAFERAVLKLVGDFAPPLRARIDEGEFGLARPGDVIRGGITPTVRTGWARLDEHTFAVALGDAWTVNDPLSGQGANLGSRTAFALADAIAGDGPFDEDFVRRFDRARWEFAEPVVRWSNSTIGPPQPQMLDIFWAATRDRRVADGFASNFDDPAAQWDAIRDPETTAAWLSRF